jgi:hypothetical protein
MNFLALCQRQIASANGQSVSIVLVLRRRFDGSMFLSFPLGLYSPDFEHWYISLVGLDVTIAIAKPFSRAWPIQAAFKIIRLVYVTARESGPSGLGCAAEHGVDDEDLVIWE